MSEGNKDEILSEFVSITAVDSERARFYLESSAWHLDLALASFYETDGDAMPTLSDSSRSDSVEVINVNDDIEVLDDIPPPPAFKAETSSGKPKPKQKQNSRFATLASLNKETSSDEEEGQAFYAGGSEHSGQQVLGPGKKKKDFVAEMFKAAQEHDAEVIDPNSPEPGRVPSTFTGTGYRLGQSSNDTEVVALPSTRSSRQMNEVVLKLWKEGFSVNDGPLRDYTDPANQDFLDHVRRGEVPDELLQEYRGTEVSLKMEDHRHEDYVMLKPKVKAFAGKGFMLGSVTPTVTGTTTVIEEKDRIANEKAAQDNVKLDESSPVTTLMIRFADRTSVRAKFNHSHTIADVHQFITIARPQFEHQTFVIAQQYPNKEFKNNSQTLAEAGILNAALTARLT